MSNFSNNENKNYFKWGLGQADVMHMAAILSYVACFNQGEVPPMLKEQAENLLRGLFDQTRKKESQNDGIEFRVSVGFEAEFDTVVNDWMPSYVEVFNIDSSEGTFDIRLKDVSSILDIVREIGCSLKFDIICDTPVITMKID